MCHSTDVSFDCNDGGGLLALELASRKAAYWIMPEPWLECEAVDAVACCGFSLSVSTSHCHVKVNPDIDSNQEPCRMES